VEKPVSGEQAVAAARARLYGLKANDVSKVGEKTLLPLVYATTGGKKLCDGKVADRSWGRLLSACRSGKGLC
jgi:hypothetical protein